MVGVHHEARNCQPVQGRAGPTQQGQSVEQVARDERQHDIELEVTRLRSNGDGGVVTHHLGGNLGHGFGDDRIHLTRHDAAAGLQRGQGDFAKPCQRPAVHPAQIVGDLHEHHRQHLETAGQFQRCLLAGQGGERIVRGAKRLAGPALQCSQERGHEARGRVQSRSDRRSALGECQQPLPGFEQAATGMGELGLPGAEFLRHPDRSGVHEMGASGLDDIVEFDGPPGDALFQGRHGGQQFLVQCEYGADVNGGRDDVIAALSEVDLIVGVHAASQRSACEMRDDLVHVHVGAGTRPGLIDINRKLVGVSTPCDGLARLDDGPCGVCIEQTKHSVRFGCRRLDQTHRLNEPGGHRLSAELEILERPLGLRAPARIGRDVDRPHAVMLGTNGQGNRLHDESSGGVSGAEIIGPTPRLQYHGALFGVYHLLNGR